MTNATRAEKAKASKRPPLPDYEADLNTAAAKRVLERREAGGQGPQFTVESTDGNAVRVMAKYADDDASANVRAMDLFASCSAAFASVLETQILNAAGINTKDAQEVARANDAAHAFIAGLAPQTQTEALFAVQMWALHCATMRMASAHGRATMMPQLSEYGLQMNRTARTFVTLVEGLAKQRSGGKQQVEVRYVYVDARGSQNVIGYTGGGGAPPESGRQPHGPAMLAHLGDESGALAPGLPMRSEDPEGDRLPVAGDEREAPLSPARRRQPRSPKGAGERALPSWAAHQGSRGDAA